MGRHSCCQKQKLKKGLWSPEEDEKLVHYITKYGHGCWSTVPKQAGLQRCGKSCRLRWINYLRPDLKRGIFTQEEEELIIELHSALGNRWSQIATQLPGRTDNEIKNYWNTCIKKKLKQAGIDPNTHKPIAESNNAGAGVESTSTITSSSQQHGGGGIQGGVNDNNSPAAEESTTPSSKRSRIYPAVLEDILFAGRITEKGDSSKQQEQEQQKQQEQASKQLTTDNLLEKFLTSPSADKQNQQVQKIGTHLIPADVVEAHQQRMEFLRQQQQQQQQPQQQQPEFSFPVPSSTSNFSSPMFWVLQSSPNNLELPGCPQFGDLSSTGFYGDTPFMATPRSISSSGTSSSSVTPPLVSTTSSMGGKFWDTSTSSSNRWNYSHKLESSDGSCESHQSLESSTRWTELLPGTEAGTTTSCGMQELHQHQHHQQHQQQQQQQQHQQQHQQEQQHGKFVGNGSQQVGSTWPSASAITTTSSMVGDLSAFGSIMSPELQRLAAVMDQIM